MVDISFGISPRVTGPKTHFEGRWNKPDLPDAALNGCLPCNGAAAVTRHNGHF